MRMKLNVWPSVALVPVAFNLECEARIDTASDMDVGAKSDPLDKDEKHCLS